MPSRAQEAARHHAHVEITLSTQDLKNRLNSHLEAPNPGVVQHLQDAWPPVRLLVQRSSNEVRGRLRHATGKGWHTALDGCLNG
jgi:hypothetical protein